MDAPVDASPLDTARVVAEALRQAGLDDRRPFALGSLWRDAGVRDAVDRWPRG